MFPEFQTAHGQTMHDSLSMSAPENAMIILGAIEKMSEEKNREVAQGVMMKILAEFGGVEKASLYNRIEEEFEPCMTIGRDLSLKIFSSEDDWPFDEEIVMQSAVRLSSQIASIESVKIDERTVAHALIDKKGLAGILLAQYRDGSIHRPWWINAVLKIYQNQINLINEAERDTLTGLFNRKTFESRMNQIFLAQRTPESNPGDNFVERRKIRPGEHHWIAVVDIDHFKSINDRFGHIYGDEVLILLSRLMTRGFRLEDRLFRFGGEEFVIVLSPCNSSGAAAVFERFRTSIEKYDFPQVGRVTISLGYTRLKMDDMASVAVGRADEALYFAKRNGRNRVCNFEILSAAGDIVAKEMPVNDITLF